MKRATRAALLDKAVYEELAQDPSATKQALAVVLVVAGVAGITRAFSVLTIFAFMSISGGAGESSASLATLIRMLSLVMLVLIVLVAVWPLATWIIPTTIAHFVGTRIFDTNAPVRWVEVARGLGFAQSPGVLGIVAPFPTPLGVGLLIWQTIAVVVALRESLRISTEQAVITGALSWGLVWGIVWVLLALLGV